MNRIITIVGLLYVGFALTATSASAQYYGHGEYGHGGYGHGGYGHGEYGHGQDVDRHYGHGPHHGVHAYHNHYHGGYHATDYLAYPVHPPAYVYAAPVYDQPANVDSLAGDYYCPDSDYCPQAEYALGGQYAPHQSPGQSGDYAYGQSQPLNDPSHAGHDHSGHDHAGHDHSNLGNAYASPPQPQDRSYVPAPSLERSPQYQPAPQQQPNSYSGIRPNSPNSLPSLPNRSEAPVQMDGPPPQI